MLEQTLKVLQKALREVEEKARRVAVEHDAAAKKDAENAHRDQILAQIKGDKHARQVC